MSNEKSIFLEAERCGDCTGRRHNGFNDDVCSTCAGTGRRFSLTLAKLGPGYSYRILDLLIQVCDGGAVRARFDSWPKEKWLNVTTDFGLHSILRCVGQRRINTKPAKWNRGDIIKFMDEKKAQFDAKK